MLVPAKTLSDAARMMASGIPVRVMIRGELASSAARAAASAADSLHAAEAMIGFETAGRRLTTRLIAGEYIKYKSRFPEGFGSRGDMPAIPLTEAVKRVALVAERGSSVRLSFSHGKVTIEAGTEGQARARETVEADFTGEETAIAFSPHYLMDGLGAALIAATGTPGAADKPHAQAKAQGTEKAPEKAPRGKKTSAAKAQADQGQNGDGGVPAPEQARICLQFTSPSKPALITGSAGDGDAAAPDYRYLVVPLRALASA
jgi:DNA polymerase III sliding clamp (beta) subunit (PCNA family)